MRLTLFLPTGKTLTFYNVEERTNNDTFLIFEYRSELDDTGRIATFQKSSIVGWSYDAPAREG
jgi:hypothetical protein